MINKKKSPYTNSESAVFAKDYIQTLSYIKKQIQEAQFKATLATNKELIKLYWLIGKTIDEKQTAGSWGTSLVRQFAKDLQIAFPGIAGFSSTNIFRMKAFFLAYEKVAQAVPLLESLAVFNIPWGHNILLLGKFKNNEQRLWYAQKTIDHGWSRNMLVTWIESDLYSREGKAISNFKKTLPEPQSDMAQQALKDPYLFDFLTLQKEHIEKDIERGMIDHIQKLLLELGHGFAFLGRQVPLHLADEDYYIDLLFYHTKLHCYVVVELKARKFEPGDAGQIGFYLAVVDDMMKQPEDKPTIGLLLCKSKNDFTVEYALRGNANPISVASYETKLVEALPTDLAGSLPTIEEIEAELEKHTMGL